LNGNNSAISAPDEPTVSFTELSSYYIYPDKNDIAAYRETEIQRFKWNTLLEKKKNALWNDERFWQHRKLNYLQEKRNFHIQKKLTHSLFYSVR
jgi:hypothetical protein